jgi:hypothetical protein
LGASILFFSWEYQCDIKKYDTVVTSKMSENVPFFEHMQLKLAKVLIKKKIPIRIVIGYQKCRVLR